MIPLRALRPFISMAEHRSLRKLHSHAMFLWRRAMNLECDDDGVHDDMQLDCVSL